MRSSRVLTVFVLLAASCGDPEPSGVAIGQACEQASECQTGLDCQHLVCVDDRGPILYLFSPEPLTPFDDGMVSLALSMEVHAHAPGDRIAVTLDPGTAGSVTQTFDTTEQDPYMTTGMLDAMLNPGPHRLLAQLQDVDGSTYPNPSASDSVPMFVRDPVIPDTPQVVIVWPPPGYVHRRDGGDLEVEVAVLPGTFSFVEEGSDCEPLPDCQPAWAPECEAPCGPVARDGHVMVHLLDDFPTCLPSFECYLQYGGILRPGNPDVEVFGPSAMRGRVFAGLFETTGTIKLTASLAYGYHQPYPSEEQLVYDSVTITVE